MAIGKELHPGKYQEKQKVDTLLKYIDQFIKEAPNRKDKKTGRLLTLNNIQQYEATQKHLNAYASILHYEDFSFDQIDQSFNEGFVSYLQSEIIEKDDKGKNN